ncbi:MULTISPECIES: hypothetical protein [unclassified Virgibacillus]|nr:hypothetical protein [Virgibacillus sp. LDC-1]
MKKQEEQLELSTFTVLNPHFYPELEVHAVTESKMEDEQEGKTE